LKRKPSQSQSEKSQRAHQLSLRKLRKGIDAADAHLMKILARRFQVVEKVGELKIQMGLPILQKSRMTEMLESRQRDALRLGLDEKLIFQIFDLIHRASIETQVQVFGRHKTKKKAP